MNGCSANRLAGAGVAGRVFSAAVAMLTSLRVECAELKGPLSQNAHRRDSPPVLAFVWERLDDQIEARQAETDCRQTASWREEAGVRRLAFDRLNPGAWRPAEWAATVIAWMRSRCGARHARGDGDWRCPGVSQRG